MSHATTDEQQEIYDLILSSPYKPLTDEQRALYDLIVQFKDESTSPMAAALNVIIKHADKITRQAAAIDRISERLEGLLEITIQELKATS